MAETITKDTFLDNMEEEYKQTDEKKQTYLSILCTRLVRYSVSAIASSLWWSTGKDCSRLGRLTELYLSVPERNRNIQTLSPKKIKRPTTTNTKRNGSITLSFLTWATLLYQRQLLTPLVPENWHQFTYPDP
jgi:hypothetical protein